MINHFDTFAYHEELPAHMTEYYCERKCLKMLEYAAVFKAGVDLGCGEGYHMEYFRGHNIEMSGIDNKQRYSRDAGRRYYGDVKRTGFTSEVFDFAYFINVLHHLKNKDEQLQALREAARIVKPDGLVFTHEINLLNPLISLYVRHVFKHFYKIDQGNECWLSKRIFAEVPGLRLIDTRYFSFTPDFCPKWALPVFKKIDSWADGKWFSRFGAHVMYVFRRV